MTALEDYLQKAADGKALINHHLKEITKESLIQVWAAKYFPRNFAKKEGDATSKTQTDGQGRSAGGLEGGGGGAVNS
jgi:hypothetical protein